MERKIRWMDTFHVEITREITPFSDLQQMFTNISLLLLGPLEEKLDPLFLETKGTIKVHPKIITTGFRAVFGCFGCFGFS